MAVLIALLAFGATLAISIALLVLRIPLFVEPARIVADLLARAALWATPEEAQSRQDLEGALMQAGLGDRARVRYLGVRALLSAVLPLVVLVVVRPESLLVALALGWFVAAAAYMGSWYVVGALRSRRQRALRAATPAALDLLITCLEAGLSIEGSFERVARELGPLAPALGEELERFLRDVQAGVPRAEALRGLPERTGVEELGTLVDALVRSERGGKGVVTALRELARELRTLQVLEAERKAAAAGPALTVAMVVFMLPLFVVVIVGPAVMQVSNVVFGP